MLLQLAVDDPEYLGFIGQLVDFVDIMEVGTPLLKRFGLSAVSTVRERSGGKPLLVDTKTVDGGAREAIMVFSAGAVFMTVLSVASGATQEAVDRVAQERDGYVVLDTICSDKLPQQPSLGGSRTAYLGLHVPTDVRLAGMVSTAHIDAVGAMHALGFRVSIAGGINASNLEAVVEAGPEVVVVGSAITQADNPRRAAQWMSSQLPDRGRGFPPAMKSYN